MYMTNTKYVLILSPPSVNETLQGFMANRHKCSACYKQFKLKEHLVSHMRVSYHSIHQPKCGVCQKHCKSFESLREHIMGPLAKSNCSRIFSSQGCDLCLEVFDSSSALNEHKEECRLPPPIPLGPGAMTIERDLLQTDMNHDGSLTPVALDCEMVGGGNGGKDNVCARVCLVDEDENIVFHTYVHPYTLITDYRYEVTGVTEEHLINGMDLYEVREKVEEILNNGGRLLVGHSLEYDLDTLGIKYPYHLQRDTAKYPPLKKTNGASHSLKYLTNKYLGYDIQTGLHDPFEDCVSVMRLYKKMRAQEHMKLGQQGSDFPTNNGVESLDSASEVSASEEELEMMMSPDELFAVSKSKYSCWCLDLLQES